MKRQPVTVWDQTLNRLLFNGFRKITLKPHPTIPELWEVWGESAFAPDAPRHLDTIYPRDRLDDYPF